MGGAGFLWLNSCKHILHGFFFSTFFLYIKSGCTCAWDLDTVDSFHMDWIESLTTFSHVLFLCLSGYKIKSIYLSISILTNISSNIAIDNKW